MAALADKIVQHGVVTILNQIYEVDFRGFSYGFRPRRSPHQALDALNVGIQRKRVNWILDADIRGFFDFGDPSGSGNPLQLCQPRTLVRGSGFLNPRERSGI